MTFLRSLQMMKSPRIDGAEVHKGREAPCRIEENR
jgi:hypothetical protein